VAVISNALTKSGNGKKKFVKVTCILRQAQDERILMGSG
jgi:hypothetical protein